MQIHAHSYPPVYLKVILLQRAAASCSSTRGAFRHENNSTPGGCWAYHGSGGPSNVDAPVSNFNLYWERTSNLILDGIMLNFPRIIFAFWLEGRKQRSENVGAVVVVVRLLAIGGGGLRSCVTVLGVRGVLPHNACTVSLVHCYYIPNNYHYYYHIHSSIFLSSFNIVSRFSLCSALSMSHSPRILVLLYLAWSQGHICASSSPPPLLPTTGIMPGASFWGGGGTHLLLALIL